ncbi:DUF563 domain-containing protein [Erythrobacter sp. 3-20A1M]|uniref:glycosyltransferase family 61 protein n=1 Tax=Erythrobacter sp. 3-20A1M TaxID=2653850 RepID=UPI001BFC5353|nr:glycosyltransferase family 61 protein [Erythrobacter sp. 3-20A1M]QWC57956.1 DUF563 domain-containing protein [Erythrobacter sp. 3-20A1M]
MSIKWSSVRFRGDPDPLRLSSVAPREFSEVFEPLDYTPYYPRVIETSGRFTITRSAAVYPSLRLTKHTLYKRLYSFLQINAISIASLATRGSESPARGNGQYGIIHSAWSTGYYHWLTEGLPRALLLKQAFPDATALLPTPRYAPFLESLAAVGQKDPEFFPGGKNVRLIDPILTTCPDYIATTAPSVLRNLRQHILKSFEVPQNTPSRKIYVSRARSRSRYVINEEEVTSSLIKKGFEVVYAEELSFRDQVILFNQSRVLVSIHGAGLSNALFMQPGSSVIELLPYRNGVLDYHRGRNSLRHDACYVRLSAAMNLNYSFIQCRQSTPRYKRTLNSDIYVNVNDLDRALEAVY